MHGAVAEAVGGGGGEVEFLAVGLDFHKSRLVTEGDRRFIFLEAGNEAWDQQRERIMKAALLGSRDLFLRHGNLDIDHITMIGHKVLDPQGRPLFPNPHEWEIGRPVEVREGDFGVFVKGEVYRSVNPENGLGKHADFFWKSLTELQPPMRWHSSVGGTPVERRTLVDPHTRQTRRIITKARWVNVAFSKAPVNLSVEGVSTQPYGAFAKSVMWALGETCCDAAECDGPGTCFAKTVTAGAVAGGPGYSGDAAALSGGSALRVQSLEGRVVDPWSQAASRFLQRKIACEHTSGRSRLTRDALVAHFRDCEHLAAADASKAAHRLLTTIARRRSSRRAQ